MIFLRKYTAIAVFANEHGRLGVFSQLDHAAASICRVESPTMQRSNACVTSRQRKQINSSITVGILRAKCRVRTH